MLVCMSTNKTDKIKQQLDSLPKKAGTYLFRNSDGTVLYVGKAKNLRSRVQSYFRDSLGSTNPAKVSMIKKIADIETIVVGSEMEALILESTLIKKYEPRYNVLLKDDKHYLFIKVTTQEDYPKVVTVRRVSKDRARYFGPFTSAFAVRNTLRLLQRIFPYRTCELDLAKGQIADKKYRACLRHHLNRCDAPCVEKISAEDYRAVIDKVLLFLEGKLDFIVRDLEKEMQQAAQNLSYEKAARLRDQIEQIKHLTAKQVVLSPKFTNQDVVGFVTDRRRTKAFASLLMIRDGRLIGKESFVLNIDATSTDEEIARTLILNHYEQATFFPKDLILPVKLSDADAISDLLHKRMLTLHLDHSLRISQAKAGLKKRLLAIAEENALEFRAKKTHEWSASNLDNSMALQKLADGLSLPKPPKRVEIYDISNIQGTAAVGSMVVFIDGKPSKPDYRHFKIATLKEEPNDVGMMKEVLRRRLRRILQEDEAWPKPDLIIIDGGKPQLNAVLSVFEELDIEIPIASLAKREEELFVPKQKESIKLKRGSAALHLVQRMRDEAHRFAITFHRHVRSSRSKKSLLDEIVGIGPARKKLLIQKYGSVSAIADASETELGKLIGKKATEALLEQLA